MIGSTPRQSDRRAKALYLALIALFILLVFALLFARAMNRGLAHDEYHYVAGGKLLAEDFAIPYVDYPYIHTPYLAAVYAVVFWLTDYTLLGARLFSVVCMTLSAGMLFYFSYRLLRERPYWQRFLLGAFGALLLVTSPLFIRVGGLAINHQLPTLLTLVTLALLYQGLASEKPKWFVFVAGLLLGLAIGTRVSYVVTLLPFAVAIWLLPDETKNRVKIQYLAVFSGGVAAALLPLLALFLASPTGFIYGNYVYFQLNEAYRQSLGHPYGMTPLGKLVYFGQFILTEIPTDVLYLGILLYTFLAWRKYRRGEDEGMLRLLLISGLSLVLFLTSFIGTPTWAQYFFTPIPFIILGLLYGIALADSKYLNGAFIGLAVGVLLVTGAIGDAVEDFTALATPQEWFPLRAHALGEEIAAVVDEGKVLTLTPIFPLEGGLDIYHEFAAGPFIWRNSHLLSSEKRKEYGVISYFELTDFLDENPLVAILTGFEAGYAGFEVRDVGGLEAPLIAYAKEHGYSPVQLTYDFGYQNVLLWVR